jgi:hypothetical protein
MDRSLAGFAFEGSPVLTDVATITPLLRRSAVS